jgi:glycosyltransferase involved in cell wall biosynthesis
VHRVTNDGNARASESGARTVDIVVPVQRDVDAARRCVASVLAARNATAFALTAIVDGAVARAFSASAADLLADPRLTLSRTDRPLDYAALVNRAFALHAERDVVLLQADAEVYGDWLDRIAAHAGAVDAGVVATFTNTAGLASYPRSGEANLLPADTTPASLDALFARANSGQSFEAAGVFGPCLYVTRACSRATGDWRAVATDDGYASEIDFALRAARAGFRALVAGDVFVANSGEGSFGGRASRVQGHAAQTTLAHLHVGYADARRAFLARDPTRAFACRVDLARLAASPRPVLVFIAHAWGGGIRRHMNDVAALVQERAEVLYLEPAGADTVKLYWPRPGEGFAAWFRLPADLEPLVRTLRAIGVPRLHFHHVHGLPRSILELPRASELPFDVTLHDYFTICPQYHLVDERGRYCGEPDAAGCAACIAKRPAQWGLDIGSWRSMFGELLSRADRVIAPSQDVASRIGRYFPALAVSVWPHPEAAIPAPRPAVRVVTLGNLSPEKGLHVVAACTSDARARDLPLAFRVLGATTAPIAQSPDVPLTLHGSYDEAQLPALLAAEHADVLFFPAQVPETYSYTLSVALATDTPIVAAAIGALPERLAGRAHVRLLPFDADAAQWNAALLDAALVRARAASRSASAPELPVRAAS